MFEESRNFYFQNFLKQESPTNRNLRYIFVALLIFNKWLGLTERIVFNWISPSLPSLIILKKHFLLFPEIIPGQIPKIPREKPRIKIGKILIKKTL